MLVYDRQPNRAFPAIADVISNAVTGVPVYGSGISMQNKSRFSVIRDSRLTIDVADAEMRVFHMYAKGRWETEFAASGNTIGDITTGAIYLIMFEGVMLSGNITFANVTTRIRFFD